MRDQNWWDKSAAPLCLGKMELFHLLPSWVHPKGPRKRQVMNPKVAHLPIGPSSPLLTTTAAAILLFILLELTEVSWIYLSVPLVKERSYNDNVTDLFFFNVQLYCLSLHCRLCTFTTLAQQAKFVCLKRLFSCIASLLASLMHFLKYLPGPFQGAGEKRRNGSPFYLFVFPGLQDPQAGGHLFLGFTPGPRPRVRGPAPTLLIKLGCLPGPVCGVREKKASGALSLFLLLHLLFFTVFTQATLPQESEPEKVLFYLVDCQEYGFTRQLYQRSPPNGEIQKFTCAQVCERNLPRAQGAFGWQRVPIFTHVSHTFH